jgi:hypothetical protein
VRWLAVWSDVQLVVMAAAIVAEFLLRPGSPVTVVLLVLAVGGEFARQWVLRVCRRRERERIIGG